MSERLSIWVSFNWEFLRQTCPHNFWKFWDVVLHQPSPGQSHRLVRKLVNMGRAVFIIFGDFGTPFCPRRSEHLYRLDSEVVNNWEFFWQRCPNYF